MLWSDACRRVDKVTGASVNGTFRDKQHVLYFLPLPHGQRWFSLSCDCFMGVRLQTTGSGLELSTFGFASAAGSVLGESSLVFGDHLEQQCGARAFVRPDTLRE